MNGAKSGPSPRRVAVRILREIEQRQGFSNRILSEQLERHPELERRDRGLITMLVYGVLRHRGRLDKLIDSFADKPKKVKGELRMILRVAAFELVELERPLGIANAEAGKLARRIDPHGRLSGMITAILHMIDRDWPIMDVALSDGHVLDALTGRWSLPRWLAARWLAEIGPEQALARARALSVPPTVDLRVDIHRSGADSLRELLRAEQPKLEFIAVPEPAGDQPQCLRVRGGGDLFYGPAFEAGLFSIQSLGSQQAVRALAPQAGERVLDACAGMGTKTIQIAEHMGRRGSIVAVDSSGERLAELDAGRERAGLDGELTLEIIEAELGGALPDHAQAVLRADSFDAVLLDAPCTGLGNLGRHPELRWTAVESNIGDRAALQATLLRWSASLVRPGGRLVYAVCSLEPEEGEAIVAEFCSSDAGQAFTRELTQSWTPEQHHTDGFWLARLRRA
ncbi:16S rRNA (cytosine(967)-C(5))-methyltransferase [Enhygromyxa salina]|uniref:16S rRNA (Cytosine(967)-C(5))-methyltransferase n=1 Tax=Enhygromyxa salina TaxID=215803 RepID=A0A0C2D6F9_9BACT|nr:transcription antitermination factor NusB [Enhygromyxa salina]KIG17215.1 16S rRNA (cytosine(967)-C(5))-methyltransferase [Enhygromyxa salina]